MRYIFFASLMLFAASCADVHPRKAFEPARTPARPDYAQLSAWAAHPQKNDPSDRRPEAVPAGDTSRADVFFLHPTTLTGSKRYERGWNGDVADEKLNEKTDGSSILYQASAFNAAGRVFAPRYRQAHLNSFFTKDKKSANIALDTAYTDVLAAFRYYLKHWNQGRPIVLAGHSQGARHALYLLRNEIENNPELRKRVIVTYMAGWPVKAEYFKSVQPCARPDQTDCYCSWRTWERDFGRKHAFENDVVCTNPLLWTITPGEYAPASRNLGGVVQPFKTVRPALADAEVYKGIVLCKKPKFPGSFFFRRKNYHIGDINLYYINIRENAWERVQAWERTLGKR